MTKLHESEKLSAQQKPVSVLTNVLEDLSNIIGLEGMNKVIQSYIKELPNAEKSINQLIAEKKLEELHKVGHRNKSSSETVGAMELANLFKQLEQTDKIESAAELSSKINLESKAVLSELQEHLTHI